MANLNLIRFLDFYFTLMFIIGLYRRVGQYREMGRIALSGPGRWPHLLELIKQHRTILMTWSTVLPGLLALLVAVVQLVASQEIWPHAEVTFGQLLEILPALLLIAPLGLAMFGVDIYGVVSVARFDRLEMEKYFDQAEYWLRSHTAHVVRIFTLGYIDPRRMVAVEVRSAGGRKQTLAGKLVVDDGANGIANIVRAGTLGHVGGNCHLICEIRGTSV